MTENELPVEEAKEAKELTKLDKLDISFNEFMKNAIELLQENGHNRLANGLQIQLLDGKVCVCNFSFDIVNNETE